MAQQNLIAPPTPRAGPNLSDASEFGESWSSLISKLNAMLTDLYAGIESSANNITAHAGGGQGSATPLTARVNRVTTVATVGDSVALPVSTPGDRCVVVNATTTAMQVYGQGSDTINEVAAATGVSQAGKSVCVYTCGAAGVWDSNDTGDGFAGNFSTVSVSPPAGLTAHAGGGQASATPCTNQINRFSVVASANDSGLLPPAIHGLQITVINDTATNSMNLFPASQAQGGATGGDQINALGQNAAFAIAAGKQAIAFCSVDGKWHMILSA